MSNELMNLIDTVEIAEVAASLNKVASIQAAISGALKSGHDFDKIPGTQKPTLLKPGAEKILMMFGLTSEYEIIDSVEDWKSGVFSYTIKCVLSKGENKITEGFGSCNSKEDKYRYRWVRPEDVPAGVDISTLKTNTYNKVRIENDEIYTQVNTILKMAKKRAQVDATLTVASLSEIFTQDLDDLKSFNQNEQIDTMTVDEAKKFKLNFGKHKGKALGDLINTNPDYLEWVVLNTKDEVLRKGVEIVLSDLKAKTIKEGEEMLSELNDLKEEDMPF